MNPKRKIYLMMKNVPGTVGVDKYCNEIESYAFSF